MCIINGGAQCKFVVLVFKQRSVPWDSDALRKPATAYALTLAAMPRTIMRQIIGLTIILTLSCCARDNRLEVYNQIVDSADKIKISKLVDNDWKLESEVAGKEKLQFLKDVLKRNINPETQRKFKADKKFEIVKDDKVVGQLLILHPFVNFTSDNLGFGFRLTYGIGMYPAN